MSLVLGLAIVAFLVSRIGLDEIAGSWQPYIPLLLLAALAIDITIFIFALRWSTLVNSLAGEQKVSALDCFFYSISSLAAGLLFAQTASLLVVRSASLNRLKGIPLSKSIASVLIDKLFDLSYILLFIVPTLMFLFELVSLEQAVVLALVVFAGVSVLVVTRQSLSVRAIQIVVITALELIPLVPFVKNLRIAEQLDKFQNRAELELLQPTTTGRAYWLTAVGEVMLILRSWLIAQALGLDVSPLAIFMGITLSQMSLFVAITPGGLGITEATWYLALAGSHVEPGAIGVFLIAHRVFQSITIALTWFVLYVARWLKKPSALPSASSSRSPR